MKVLQQAFSSAPLVKQPHAQKLEGCMLTKTNTRTSTRMATLRLRTLAAVVALTLWASPGFTDTVHVTDDSFINLNRPNQNKGTNESVRVNDAGAGRHGLARFKLSTLPLGTTSLDIDRATLRLFPHQVNTAGTLFIQVVEQAWDEASVTAGNAPAFAAFVTSDVAIAPADKKSYVTADITAVVQDWVDGVVANHGLALTSADGLNVQFNSKENRAASHPFEIEVALIGPAGADGAVGPAGTQGPQDEQGPVGPASPIGPAGPAGADGAAGPAGPAGPAGSVPAGACPLGEIVTGIDSTGGVICTTIAQVLADAETPPPPPPLPAESCETRGECRIFVTSTTYRSDLGGLQPYDAACQQRADAASLGGEYKAWLSTDTENARDRLTQSTVFYVRTDGFIFARSFGFLGFPSIAPNLNEFSQIVQTGVWTGTKSSGFAAQGFTCQGWTTTGDGVSALALIGTSASGSGSWTESTSLACVGERP